MHKTIIPRQQLRKWSLSCNWMSHLAKPIQWARHRAESAMLYPLQVEHLRDRSFTALSSMVEQTTNSSVLMENALHLRPYIQLWPMMGCIYTCAIKALYIPARMLRAMTLFISRQHQSLRLLPTASIHGSTTPYMSAPHHSEHLVPLRLMYGE